MSATNAEKAKELLSRILGRMGAFDERDFHAARDAKVEIGMLVEFIVDAAVDRVRTGRLGQRGN